MSALRVYRPFSLDNKLPVFEGLNAILPRIRVHMALSCPTTPVCALILSLSNNNKVVLYCVVVRENAQIAVHKLGAQESSFIGGGGLFFWVYLGAVSCAGVVCGGLEKSVGVLC